MIQMSDRSNLKFLDGLRGIAAFYVVVGHARWLLWEGFVSFRSHPQGYSMPEKLLVYTLSLFRYGHEAVLFFFVLSGFVIHLRYAHSLKAHAEKVTFDWFPFLWRRMKRLYPPLLCALALTFALDSFGKHLGYSIYEHGTVYPLINESIASQLDVRTLWGNLAFLMRTYVPVFGCNGPLWSLKFEWWFYMFYPIFWLVTRKSITLATLLMVLLFGASFLPNWPMLLLRDVFSAMLTWWLGVILADIYSGRINGKWSVFSLVSISLGVAGLCFFPVIHDLAMATFFTGTIAGCFALAENGFNLSLLKKLKPLGDMSYSLYVTHFPVLVLLSGYLMSRSKNSALPPHFGWVFLGIFITLALAFAVHLVAERPFTRRAQYV